MKVEIEFTEGQVWTTNEFVELQARIYKEVSKCQYIFNKQVEEVNFIGTYKEK